MERADLNFAFHADPELADAWWNWFEWVWVASVPLTPETEEIPALVVAPGTVEAADAWQAYLTRCREARSRSDPPSQAAVAVDGESGQVTVTEAGGTLRPSVGEQLGIPRLDHLAGRIARIFRLGTLVSVDKTSRIPPLDVPVKAELFGVRSGRQEDVGSRRLEYRFTVLDAQTLRDVEGKRKATGRLLSRFSFPLADGVRWMPYRASALFEAELDRLNRAGKNALSTVMGDDVGAFVKGRRDRVAKAAQAFYEEHHPGQRVTESTVDTILELQEARLKHACQGQLLPKITYTPVQFAVVEHASDWASPWGQAASLLQALAEFPRKALTDPFFFRDLAVDDDALAEAMDVCEDAVWKIANRRDSKQQAKEDLRLLTRLSRSQNDARSRCSLIVRLIGGAKAEVLGVEVRDEETT